jgi:hypothetical protein
MLEGAGSLISSPPVQALMGTLIAMAMAVIDWRFTVYALRCGRCGEQDFDYDLVMGPLNTPGLTLSFISVGFALTFRIACHDLVGHMPGPRLLNAINWADVALFLSFLCAVVAAFMLHRIYSIEGAKRRQVLEHLLESQRRMRVRLLLSNASWLRTILGAVGVVGALMPILVILRVANV